MARIRRAAQSAPQEVLVPEAEQPYAVPENWRWVRLGKVVNVSQNKTNVFCPDTKYVGLEHIAKHLGVVSFGTASEIKSVKSIFKKGDILYGKLRPYLNKHDVADFSGVCSTDIIVLQAKALVDREFVNYFFDLNIFIEYATSHCRGINLPRVSTGVVLDACFPLPPRAEQERIVARIESLFARLDKAREKVDAVLGRCAARKAALLHKAFSGELTAAWRKARGIGLESWEEKLSGQLFSYVTSGSRGWAKYYSEEGALFIRMGNLSHETIELNLSEVQHVKLPDDIEGQRSKLKNNDILISITADVGMVALVRDINFEGYINQHVALARPVSTVCPEFLALYLISDAGKKELKARQRGSTKVGLGLDDIKSLHLKMPTLAEQAEIVRILDELLARERRARDAAERVAARIEQIKRAVLTKAFRGELGTNDPAEPAALTEQGSLSLA